MGKRVLLRGQVTQGAVRPHRVVLNPPALYGSPRVRHRQEPVFVQALIPKASVEAYMVPPLRCCEPSSKTVEPGGVLAYIRPLCGQRVPGPRWQIRTCSVLVNAAEIYMRLALKAQSQCRATLETLAAIKNPTPVTFVKQANVAHGPQQVNNGPPSEPPSRARESENPPNELLEHTHGERLDFGTPKAAVGADSALATVGEVHRAANTNG